MSANRCLSSWYDASGRPNEIAVECPLDGEVEHRLRGADRLGRLDHQRQLQLTLHIGICTPGLAHHRRSRHAHAVELDSAVPTGQVEAPERCDRHAGRVGRDQELREPVAAVAVTSRRSACAAASTGAAVPASGTRRHRPRARDGTAAAARRRLAHAPRGHELAGDDRGQHLGALLVARRPRERGRHHVGGQQRPGRGVPAELVGHQREVDHAPPAHTPATEVLRDQERGPTQLRALAPVVTVEALLVLGERPDGRDRRLAVEEPPGRVPEELLVVGQGDLHATSW